MACSQYLTSIQEYVDGTLGAIRRAELEQHLAGCDECRAFAADLARIRDRASALRAVPLPDGLWLQIAGRLRQEGRVRDMAPVKRRVPVAAWAAMAAGLIIAIGGSLVVLRSGVRQAPAAVTTSAALPPAAGNAPDTKSVEDVQNELASAQTQYQTAIAHLEQIAKANQSALDPQTARTLQKNLAITDMAIADSSAAVHAEPTSVAAREALFDALKQKVSLLQDTISLINEMRKGNNVGAAQVLNKS
ncbi:MAG TPA: zf-HC2 domain-containing protein [Vicinamibacterales bacterium]|jgi:anti-sigma factor RsiW|nr:zf-HC2 domain-containing protein [Vicinamibacterales bacterium]